MGFGVTTPPEPHIVTVSTDYHNAKEACGILSEFIYEDVHELRKKINSLLTHQDEDGNPIEDQPTVHTLKGYVYESNEQFINHENYFLALVHIHRF